MVFCLLEDENEAVFSTLLKAKFIKVFSRLTEYRTLS